MGVRVKGQETTITITGADGTEDSLEDVKSAEFTFERDILSEGYLGQTTQQKDAVFNGVTGKLEVHLSKASVMDFVFRLNEQTRRRLAGEQWEVATSIDFPDGQRRRVIIPDAQFGSIPFNMSGREEFVTLALDFAADDADILAA